MAPLLSNCLSELYESIKRRRRVYDFTDMLTKIYELLLKRKDILERIQKFYEYVVVDEVQDFTPLMMELLRLFVNNGTPVLCIGDEDQSIYGFRGADIYNTLHFSDKFPGGEVFLLNRNRRCGRKIIEAASKIINKNAMRYKKRIGVVREGGDIQYVPYLTTEGQLLNGEILPTVTKTVKISEYNREASVVFTLRLKSTIEEPGETDGLAGLLGFLMPEQTVYAATKSSYTVKILLEDKDGYSYTYGSTELSAKTKKSDNDDLAADVAVKDYRNSRMLQVTFRIDAKSRDAALSIIESKLRVNGVQKQSFVAGGTVLGLQQQQADRELL